MKITAEQYVEFHSHANRQQRLKCDHTPYTNVSQFLIIMLGKAILILYMVQDDISALQANSF